MPRVIAVFVAKGRAETWTRVVALLVAGLATLALLAHVVGLSRQNNLPVIGLALLPALVIAWGTMARREVRADERTSGRPVG